MLRRQNSGTPGRLAGWNDRGSHRLAVFVGLASSLSAFSIAAVIPATKSLSEHFKVTVEEVQSSVTIYLTAYALMCVVHGPLSDAVGRGRVITWGLAFYLIATTGCAFAATFEEFTFWRFGQGMSSGVAAVVGRALIGDVSAGQDAAKSQGVITLMYAITAPLGPIVGAALSMGSGWASVFWALLGFAALLVCISVRVPRLPLREQRDGLHWAAYVSVLGSREIQKDAIGLALYYTSWWIFIGLSPVLVLNQSGSAVLVAAVIAPLSIGAAVGAGVALSASRRLSAGCQMALGFVISAVAFVLAWGAYSLGSGAQIIALFLGLHAAGGALVFPVVLTRMFSRSKDQRGLVSSVQSATTLGATAVVTQALSMMSWRLIDVIALSLLMFVSSVMFLGVRSY